MSNSIRPEDIPTYQDLEGIKDDFTYRRAKAHVLLYDLYRLNKELFHFRVLKKSRRKPFTPVEYEVLYSLKSINGVKADRSPIYGNSYSLHIWLPKNYPLQRADCKLTSPIWHPNFLAYKTEDSGKQTWHICPNEKNFGLAFTLDKFVARIGEMIQYQRYWAIQAPPFPDDSKVAAWVRSYAEEKGIVDRSKNIAVDDRLWVKPWELPDNPSGSIVVKEKKS